MSTPANILMVDDQPAKLLTYETILSSLGQNLIRASSGSQALDQLLKHDISVVLMDVCMPDLDGFELAAMIRQHPRFQRTAIILVSAIHMTELDRIKGYEVGAVDYVLVPVVPEILRAKVSVFVELYKKTQQLEELNLKLEKRVSERTADLESALVKLQEHDRRKDEFLAILAHELRNPLAPIATAAKVLDHKAEVDPEVKFAKDIITRQTKHLTRLVDDLLDLHRIERNRLDLRLERVELKTVIDAALETTRPVIKRAGQQLMVSMSSEPVFLDADVVRLSQVFTNLLNNSAKFTRSDGCISVSVEAKPGQVEVMVKDTGVGIQAVDLERIWEPFFQPNVPAPGTQEGLGLGLALVLRVVELHGGKVTAASDGTNKGSQFVVSLPRQEAPASAPQPVDPVEMKLSPEQASRILVVDDNRDSADALALALELEGHAVTTAYSGVDALTVAQDFRPDAVLLDIGMPQLSGLAVARELRSLPWGKSVLLVAQTGWGGADDIQRCREAGFDHHFTKPVDFTKLRQYLTRLQARTAHNS